MRTSAFIILMFFLQSFEFRCPAAEDWFKVAKAMSGDYTVVGKKPDSNTTYLGHLSFHAIGKKLEFIRSINHVTVRGTAFFDNVADDDQGPVLRLRFWQGGKLYEGTYLWDTDYDNRVQISGYVYRFDETTRRAGLETLFPVPPSVSP